MAEEYVLTQEALLDKLKNHSCMQEWDAICSYELTQFNVVLAQSAQPSAVTLTKTFLAEGTAGQEIIAELSWPMLSFREDDTGQFCYIGLTAAKVSKKQVKLWPNVLMLPGSLIWLSLWCKF